jgi:hypothetical protein
MIFLFYPIFIDIAGPSFVFFSFVEPISPVHLGFIVILIYSFFNVASELISLKFNRLSLYGIYLFILSCTLALIFTQVPIINTIQFFSLYLFLPLGIYSIYRSYGFMFRFLIVLDTALLVILLISIASLSDLIEVTVYQLLVTFPATLILYAYMLLIALDYFILVGAKYMKYIIFLNLCVIITIVLVLARKVGFLDILILLCVVQVHMSRYIYRNVHSSIVVKKSFIFVLLFIYPIAFVILLNLFINSNLLARFLGDLASGEGDGSRLSNWVEGLVIIFLDFKSFVFGGDFSYLTDLNYHNFFIDSAVRFGVPLTVAMSIFLILILRDVYNRVGYNKVSRIVLFGVFANIFLHSTVNSALSQSMYIASLTCCLAGILFFTELIQRYHELNGKNER